MENATLRQYKDQERWRCPHCGQKQNYDLFLDEEKGLNPDTSECWRCKNIVRLNYRRFRGRNF